jgi:hypothetical protein
MAVMTELDILAPQMVPPLTDDLLSLLRRGWHLEAGIQADDPLATAACERLGMPVPEACQLAALSSDLPRNFYDALATIEAHNQNIDTLAALQNLSNQFLGRFVRVKGLHRGSYPVLRYHRLDPEQPFRTGEHTPPARIQRIEVGRGRLRLAVPMGTILSQAGDYYIVSAIDSEGIPQVNLTVYD